MTRRPWWLRWISIPIGNAIARRCDRLAVWAEEWGRRLDRCPDCGAVKFYENPGPECPGFEGYRDLSKEERARRMDEARRARVGL